MKDGYAIAWYYGDGMSMLVGYSKKEKCAVLRHVYCEIAVYTFGVFQTIALYPSQII